MRELVSLKEEVETTGSLFLCYMRNSTKAIGKPGREALPGTAPAGTVIWHLQPLEL